MKEDRRKGGRQRTGEPQQQGWKQTTGGPALASHARVISHWLTRAVQRSVENALNHLTLTASLGISSARIPEES